MAAEDECCDKNEISKKRKPQQNENAARRRAWMHAAGALTTKAIPFALLPAALAADLPGWVPWLLGAAGAVMVATDLLWSTRASDWKKFRREMRYARR